MYSHHILPMDDTSKLIEAENPPSIELRTMPDGFLAVSVGDKHFLLPRQFAGMLLRYREDQIPHLRSASAASASMADFARREVVAQQRRAIVSEAKGLCAKYNMSYKEALRQIYTQEVAKMESETMALAALKMIYQDIQGIGRGSIGSRSDNGIRTPECGGCMRIPMTSPALDAASKTQNAEVTINDSGSVGSRSDNGIRTPECGEIQKRQRHPHPGMRRDPEATTASAPRNAEGACGSQRAAPALDAASPSQNAEGPANRRKQLKTQKGDSIDDPEATTASAPRNAEGACGSQRAAPALDAASTSQNAEGPATRRKRWD
ncbi:hypothetical protein FPV67DRAFT_1456572 [Lyophyllum atratum]|nr:hypothetical protein FPV67DRAFT_1456572 [Lyophyllum atratum]